MSCARLRCVALAAHICGFIAGAIRIGLSVASRTAVGEIVGMAAGHFGDQIGGRRRHHDEIGVAREADMADVEFALRIEQIGIGALAGERAGGKRRDEMLRGLGEDAAHARAAILQAADEIERLIGGDAAADDEQNARAQSSPRQASALVRRLAGPAARIVRATSRPASSAACREDDAHLVFHRAAVARGAQPQQLLQPLVELADGEAGHRAFRIVASDI